MHDPPACGILPTHAQQWENNRPVGSMVGYCDEGSSRYYFTGGFARCMAEVSTNSADVLFRHGSVTLVS